MRRKKSDKDIQRDILYNLFGITIEQYEQVLKLQNGKCAVCGGIQTKDDELIVDYCYKTLRIRGLLCHNCNHGLITFNDDPELLEKAALYLRGQLCAKRESN